MFLDLNLNVYDIFYATDGKIKKVGSVDVNSLKKIKGTRQDSNFNSSIPNSSKNVKTQYSFAGEKAKTAVPLSGKYRTEAVTQFAQNPDADVRYSIPSVGVKQQLKENLEKLNSMEIVATLNEQKSFTSKQNVAEWALSKFEKIGFKVYRNDFGEIILDKKRIKKGLSYLKTNEERLALALLPDVLSKGIEIGSHSNHKGRNYNTFTFAAPISINGQRGNMAAVVRQEDKNYYKVHRLLMPDGSQFVLDEKRDTAETAGGVDNNSGLSPTDNVSKISISDSNEKVKTKLEERVTGVDLLNAQDLIEEIKSVGGEVDENGYVTVYHRTTENAKEKILSTGIMTAKEDGVFFSTKPNGQIEGYGSAIIKISIPIEKLVLDDIFDNEAHLRYPLKTSKATLNISEYINNITTEGKDQYSLPDIDRYTEKQYNDFGWVRTNDVLTAAEYSDLISNYTGHKHVKDNYPITRFGETVIHSAQYTDVLMYVKGSIKNPQITKVVVIDKDNPIDLAAIREEILLNEREQQLLPFSFIEKYYGPEVLIVHKARDYASYREYRAKLERSDSQKSNTVSGTERDRTGSTKPNKRTDRADPIDGAAYSLPKSRGQFSISDIARGKTAPELWEMSQKGEITSDDALKVLAEQHGTMPKGESPKVDVTLPEQISKSKNVNQFMRNVLESGHLDADIPTIDFFEIGTYNKIN